MWYSILIYSSILVAGFVHGATGFGFGVFIMAIWPLFMPVVDAIQLMSFGAAFVIFAIFFRHVRHVNFRVAALPMSIALVGTVVGMTALFSVENDVAVKAFGILLVLLAAYLFFFSDRVHVSGKPWVGALAGAVSGVMGGFFSIPGPALVLYFTVATRSKEEYIATLQFSFTVQLVLKIIYFWARRGISTYIAVHIPGVIAASAVGIVLGLRLFDRVSAKTLRRMVLVVMVVSGVWYIIG